MRRLIARPSLSSPLSPGLPYPHSSGIIVALVLAWFIWLGAAGIGIFFNILEVYRNSQNSRLGWCLPKPKNLPVKRCSLRPFFLFFRVDPTRLLDTHLLTVKNGRTSRRDILSLAYLCKVLYAGHTLSLFMIYTWPSSQTQTICHPDALLFIRCRTAVVVASASHYLNSSYTST